MPYYEVVIEHSTIALSKQFTYYYDQPVQPGCRVFVPFGHQKLTGMVLGEGSKPTDDKIQVKEIQKVLDETPVLNEEQIQLAGYLAWQTVSPVMGMIHCMLPHALDARTSKPDLSYTIWLVKEDIDPDRPIPMTPAIAEAYHEDWKEMPLKEARSRFGDYRINALCTKGLARKEKRIINHGTLPKREQVEWPPLNFFQENALAAIRQADQRVILLHGVTGSGKTEVFFHLAKEQLEQGKQVLILVPEISLTPMMEQRIASRFHVDVYGCHSRLSESEMVSVWNNIAHAGPCIVIGTRKSVFLPMNHIGLIIMDEEHDTSYKQDTTVRYHARDAAMFRASYHNCKLLLASATPSLESYSRAVKGVYALAELPERASGHHAKIRLVDLRTARSFKNYSSELIDGIVNRLSQKQKTMILLNRRGYLPTIRCQSCHEYLRCEDCNVPLSYHKGENALVCHVCGRRYPLVEECPSCHSRQLTRTGQGTERLEEDTASLFPQARIVRMDADTTRFKGAHERLLEEFKEDGDILMGTQMIAKGLDFHDITLAGILSIDAILSRPDYLANERAYQLAEQAAGRAGRGKEEGEVIIQTFNPDHFVLRCVQNHRFRDFFVQEMRYRHAGNYPPYVFMATLVIRNSVGYETYQRAMEIKYRLESCQVEVLGPAEISMRNKQTRFRLIVKDKNDRHLIQTLWQCALWFEKNAGKSRMDINVHPMTLEE
ncbi:MAG: primosomal protein N' [Allobaculum sp.]